MTTNVDILFKELPAQSRASDRISRPDASPVGSTYGEERSSVSSNNEDQKYDKSFTAHLDDQGVDNNQPISNKVDHNNENTFDNQVNGSSETEKAAPTTEKENTLSKEESTPTTLEPTDGENAKTVVAATVAPSIGEAPEISVQNISSTTKNLLLSEVAPEKAVLMSNGNSALINSKSENIIIPEVALNKVATSGQTDNTAHGNTNNEKGLQTALLNNNVNAENKAPVFAPATSAVTDGTVSETSQGKNPVETPAPQVTAPQAKSEELPIQTASVSPQSNSAPTTEVQKSVQKPAQHPVQDENSNNSNGLSQSSLQTLAVQEKGKPGNIAALVDVNSEEILAQETGVVISAMAKAMSDEIATAPLMEKPAVPTETVAVESSKALPFSLIQSQNNAQKSSSGAKKSNVTSAEGGITKATNASATNASAMGTQNSAQGGQAVTLQSATKSDIQFDLGANGQRFDQILPQNTPPNGQTPLTAVGLLAAQDINFQKSMASLGATMKTDTPMNAKMVNEQITVAINKNVVKGLNNFSIRLHPVELGQIDIRLEFAHDGKMQATMMVESEKTLTMLQRDQSALEKALQDAGVNISNKNMNFSLMKQNDQNNTGKFASTNNPSNDDEGFDEFAQAGTMQEIRMAYSNQAVDISV